jgi:tetratricopeptide (TPR) repeat protein
VPKHRLALLFLFALALALRAIYLVQISGTPFADYLLGDGIAYDAWARRIAAGDWWGSEVFYQAPFYPYVLGILYAVGGASLLWVRVVQAVLGALGCVLVAAAGKRFLGEREGLTAGLLVAAYPPAIFFDGEIQKSSFDLLFSAVLLFLIAGLRDTPRVWRAIAAGVTVGLFTLNRENALLLIPLLAGWLLFRRRFAFACAFIAAALGTLLPVALRNRAIGGELLLTTSQLGPNFYIGNHEGASGRYEPLRPGRGSARYEREDAIALAESASGRSLSPAEVSDYWLGRGLAFVREEPGRWTALMARKWFLLWNRRELIDTTSIETAGDFSSLLRWLGRVYHFGVLLPLAVAGMWLTRRRWRELGVLYLLLAGWAIAVTAFFVLARYRYPMVPILALFAGAALVEAIARRRVLIPAIALAVAAAIFANWPIAVPDPRAATYANLGNAMSDTGKAAEGARMLERAVAVSPNFAEAHLALGHVRLKSGDSAAAEASYRRAIELGAPQSAAWNNLGLIAARAGRRAEAMAAFDRALAINARDTNALHNLARMRFANGEHAWAATLYRQLVEIDDGDAETHHQLANLYAFDDDLVAARRHYERALALDPARADAHFKLSVILDRFGESDAATRHLARAIQLVPGYGARYLRLAADAERAGRRPEAVRLYRQLLAAVPGQRDAVEALRRLQ